MVTDSSGIIVWVNNTFSKMTGYSAEEAIGKTPKLLKSGKQDSSFYERMWRKISSGKVWHGELINKCKDGSLCHEDITISPIKTKNRSITHYVAVKRNLSSLHQTIEKQQGEMLESVMSLMEQLKDVTGALEQARSEMHAMLNATAEAMVLLSPDDTMLWQNKAFSHFFALKQESAARKKFKTLTTHWSRVFENEAEVFQLLTDSENQNGNGEKRVVLQVWPQKRELEIYAAPVKDASNGYLGQLVVFRDITHEREVERMKSEFVSLVSHEFRTPLTSIGGYTEMMLDGDAGELTDSQREYLETISRNVKHLTGIVNDLLEVSRLEAGAIKLETGIFYIAFQINDCVERLQPQIDKKGQEIAVKIPAGLPQVVGDPNRINQVIMNLLSNAHKYTPSGGRITIRADNLGEYLRIDIQDTGIGMTLEEQRKMFTKFYRATNSETIKAGGTGLGLWITKTLVEMHGGEISVKSKQGTGSTFSFTVPVYNERHRNE